jgi:hypothetical protein
VPKKVYGATPASPASLAAVQSQETNPAKIAAMRPRTLKSTAQAETVRRREYHREYHKTKFGFRWVACPTCSGNMRVKPGITQCADCRYKFDRWDQCGCGKRKLKSSTLCHSCAGLRGGRPGRPAYIEPKPNPFCPNDHEGARVCGSQFPHRHCDCGLPVIPSRFACEMCIYEQSRLEFKVWPLEAA